jgi:hypothetical protein
MYHLIDWLSFTVESPMNRKGELQWVDKLNTKVTRRQALTQVFNYIGRHEMNTLFGDMDPCEDIGRFPYRYSVIDNSTSARMFFDSEQKHILIEVSGKGCKALSEANLMESLVMSVHTRISRIDVSADIRTDVLPVDFAAAGYDPRFKSASQHISETGQTVYVGSMKSDRQAAIYRYWAPHPRSEFLRVEHRFRRDRAKQMAKYIADNGIAAGIHACGIAFDWKHELWEPGELEIEPMPNLNVGAHDANVINWLLKQVFPAMRRYERLGKIEDLRAFVQTHLFEDDH